MLLLSASRDRLTLVQQGPVLVSGRPAQFAVTGPGAEQCVQGIVTNDIIKPGPNSLVYGAMLTPKGMIIADCWVLRGAAGHEVLVLADGAAEARLDELFRRQFPPRVAKVANLTVTAGCLWILGDEGPGLVRDRLGGCPGPGQVVTARIGEEVIQLAAPASPRAPFRILITGTAAGCESVSRDLVSAGALEGTPDDLVAARVAGGFPGLGAEIDDRTMPAEVDFDEIAGVSHGKGCYVGQETVARLHFRGHPNWLLRRVRSAPGIVIPTSGELTDDGKVVARIGTLLRFQDGSSLGLAKVRREVEPGTLIGGIGIEACN